MKHRFLVLGLMAFLPISATAADFTASVASDHVETGKNFILQLTLSGAKAKAGPDIAALKQSFTVVSEVHSANATAAGQAVNFNVDWQLTLLPKREGALTIPSLTIETAAGRLRSAPITLQVEHPAPPMPSQVSADGSKVSISATISTTTPYRNQPIRYTVRCVVRGMISKVSMDEISIANAIVERQGKPNVYDQVENGVPARVVEINYLITPLQPGRMIIPPSVLKGQIQTPALAPMIDPFGGQFMLSPKAQQAMNFFSAFGGEPFAIASNRLELDVKPSVGAMDPWLPLKSLKIKESIDASQPIHVGDLVTRKITLLAEGVVGSQLPNLEAQQNHEDFGVYADKPTMGDNVDAKTGAIRGWRKESYSLVPQKAGRLVLRAVKVTWWDVVNKKAATTELSERIVNVLPAIAAEKSPIGRVSAPPQSVWARVPRGIPATQLLYVLIGIPVAILLFGALGIWLFRRRTIVPAGAAPKPFMKKFGAGRTFKKIRTVEELRDFLQAYAQDRLGKPANASLEEIFSPPPKWWKRQDVADLAAIIDEINAALYAGRPADMKSLKGRCLRILAALRNGAGGSRKNNEELPLLNPS